MFPFLLNACLPSSKVQGFHSCTPSGSRDTFPSVGLALIRSISFAFIPAFVRARPMACLLSCHPECLPDGFHAFRCSCLPCGMPSCFPAAQRPCNTALRLAGRLSGTGACIQACLMDSTKKQVIAMRSFNVVVGGICWQCLVLANREQL